MARAPLWNLFEILEHYNSTGSILCTGKATKYKWLEHRISLKQQYHLDHLVTLSAPCPCNNYSILYVVISSSWRSTRYCELQRAYFRSFLSLASKLPGISKKQRTKQRPLVFVDVMIKRVTGDCLTFPHFSCFIFILHVHSVYEMEIIHSHVQCRF